MDLVADTNTFIAVALGEPEKDSILQVTKGCDLVAPSVLPFEVGNALTALVKKRKISSEEALAAWDTMSLIQVELKRVDVRNALKIAAERNIYAYDAYFLECAGRHRYPFLTLDRRLQAVALEMNIRLLEVSHS